MATSAVIEISKPTKIHRCVPFSNSKLSGVILFQDCRHLESGAIIEILEPRTLGNRIIIPFDCHNDIPLFIVFTDLSLENQNVIRKIFPNTLSSLWIH